MPKRSNLFQDVVAIVQRHLAGDAEVGESAMLADRVTGQEREVDVVITTRLAGQPITLSFEATSGRRPADVPWVEQTVAKHANLPTGTLVLVSEAGFTSPARQLAEVEGAVPMSAEDLSGEDRALQVVTRLQSLWPKSVALAPQAVVLTVQPPRGDVVWFRADPGHTLFLDDGTEVRSVLDGFRTMVDAAWPQLMEQIGLARISESMDRYFVLESGPPWSINVDGAERTLYVRAEDKAIKGELHPVVKLRVTGRASVKISEISLTHRRLGEVAVSYGEGEVAGQPALVVVTEGESGSKASVRFRAPSAGKHS